MAGILVRTYETAATVGFFRCNAAHLTQVYLHLPITDHVHATAATIQPPTPRPHRMYFDNPTLASTIVVSGPAIRNYHHFATIHGGTRCYTTGNSTGIG